MSPAQSHDDASGHATLRIVSDACGADAAPMTPSFARRVASATRSAAHAAGRVIVTPANRLRNRHQDRRHRAIHVCPFSFNFRMADRPEFLFIPSVEDHKVGLRQVGDNGSEEFHYLEPVATESGGIQVQHHRRTLRGPSPASDASAQNAAPSSDAASTA